MKQEYWLDDNLTIHRSPPTAGGFNVPNTEVNYLIQDALQLRQHEMEIARLENQLRDQGKTIAALRRKLILADEVMGRLNDLAFPAPLHTIAARQKDFVLERCEVLRCSPNDPKCTCAYIERCQQHADSLDVAQSEELKMKQSVMEKIKRYRDETDL